MESIHEAACQRRVLLLRGLSDKVPAEVIASALENHETSPIILNIQYAGNNCWYMVFESESDAIEAFFILNGDVKTICNSRISVCFKHAMPAFQLRQVLSDRFRHNALSAPASHVPSPTPPYIHPIVVQQPFDIRPEMIQQQAFHVFPYSMGEDHVQQMANQVLFSLPRMPMRQNERRRATSVQADGEQLDDLLNTPDPHQFVESKVFTSSRFSNQDQIESREYSRPPIDIYKSQTFNKKRNSSRRPKYEENLDLPFADFVKKGFSPSLNNNNKQ